RAPGRDTRRGTSRRLPRSRRARGVLAERLLELAELAQERKRARGLLGVEAGDGEADVDQHEVARLGVLLVGEAHAAHDAAEADLREAQPVALEQARHLAGDTEAHAAPSFCARRAAAMAAWPRETPPSPQGTRRWRSTSKPAASSSAPVRSLSRRFWK